MHACLIEKGACTCAESRSSSLLLISQKSSGCSTKQLHMYCSCSVTVQCSKDACAQVAAELSRVAPINLLRPSCRPWTGGAVSLDAVVHRLRDLLPPRFEDLEKVNNPLIDSLIRSHELCSLSCCLTPQHFAFLAMWYHQQERRGFRKTVRVR